MKNMLAMLCSNPAATNAEIGKTIAATLSITERPAAASQTARQTSALARMPRARTTKKGNEVLTAAVESAVTPIPRSSPRHHSPM